MAKAKSREMRAAEETARAEKRMYAGMGSRLDRFLESVAPGWALKRKQHRAQIMATYRAAEVGGRLRRSPRGSSGSGDKPLTSAVRSTLRNDARDLDRNNCVASGMVNRGVENIVQTGFNFQLRTADEKFNEDVEARWREYAARECDAAGRRPLWKMLSLAQRAKWIDGDVGLLQLRDGSLQPVESDQITSRLGLLATGITTDKRGRFQSFSIAPYGKGGFVQGHLSEERPAKDVYFLAATQRFSQTRGASVLAQTVIIFERIDEFIEAVVTAAIVGASQAVAITTESGGGYGAGMSSDETDVKGNTQRVQEIEPAGIHYLKPGEKVENIRPEQPTQQFGPFVQQLMRFAGLHLGLPLELAGLDFSESNYSSARAALLQAYLRFTIEQQELTDQILVPVCRRRLVAWSREMKFRRKRGDRAGWREVDGVWIPRFHFQAPKWPWVDPLKEVQAAERACESGIKSLSEISAEMGRDWRTGVEQRGREISVAMNLAATLGKATPEGGMVTWRDIIPGNKKSKVGKPADGSAPAGGAAAPESTEKKA